MGLAPSLLSRLPTPDVAGLFQTGKRREDTPSLFSRFQMQFKKKKKSRGRKRGGRRGRRRKAGREERKEEGVSKGAREGEEGKERERG